MKKVTVIEAMDLISEHKNGTIFTVDFIKKNGEYRSMNCRTGVKKYLKGGTNPLKNCDNPFLVMLNE